MLFNSATFLFAFLPITYGVFWQLTTKSQRYIWLTITGYVFYAFWSWKYCSLMAFTTLVSYLAGRGFLAWDEPFRRRPCLVLPIATDLTLLGVFRYFDLAADITSNVADWLHVPLDVPMLGLILPVGISFYTFHTISYIVDSYRGVVTPTRNLFELSCYVSLFSQLVAGPIVRFRAIERDLEEIDGGVAAATLHVGWSFFAIGMIEKVLIADTIAAVIDPALGEYAHLSTVGAWLCMLGYAYQLYFDLAGYSAMAVGLGLLFGLRIPQNFNAPYRVLNPSDFWCRWHISLSRCLRDYLYIPLGGNRGPRWCVYRNLMLTMLLGGLWHGANWTFVVWGGYPGLLLAGHRAFSSRWDRLPERVQQIAMFLLVVVGWVLFWADSFAMAASLLHRMVIWHDGSLINGVGSLTVSLVVAATLAHCAPSLFDLKHAWSRPQQVVIGMLFAICVLIILADRQSPFLYFQF
jgi:alginate O-acetyltransferase complex protein AlgI